MSKALYNPSNRAISGIRVGKDENGEDKFVELNDNAIWEFEDEIAEKLLVDHPYLQVIGEKVGAGGEAIIEVNGQPFEDTGVDVKEDSTCDQCQPKHVFKSPFGLLVHKRAKHK
jgi:hypothetical protein